MDKPLPLRQKHIDWLLKKGVTTDQMVNPSAILYADGGAALYLQEDDAIWWPMENRVQGPWCLGGEALDDADTFAFNSSLHIYADPLQWLLAGRCRGIVILDWGQAYERLRTIPRVAVPRSLLATYRKAMKHPALPEVVVRE